MLKTSSLLLFLALLCLQTEASLDDFLKGNVIRNAQATSSGIINFEKDIYPSTSFYANADFSSQSSPKTTTDTKKVILSIANLETMVASNCLSFGSYDCSKYNCQTSNETTTISFPTFTANVQYAKSHITLDPTYWNINPSESTYIAQSCQSGDTYNFIGYRRDGVLGLGTDPQSQSQNSKLFSIWIQSTLNLGVLLFKKDTNTYASSSSPSYTFSANSTWQVPIQSGSIQVGSSSLSLTGNVMFDINSDAIGLPASFYIVFFSYFRSLSNVICNSEFEYRPECYTNGELKDLPDIILLINGNQIKIPPQIYATFRGKSGGNTVFNFNFKATSPLMTFRSYVSPAFANSIILDSNFMSYYYSVFDSTSGSNVIYLYPSNNVRSSY